MPIPLDKQIPPWRDDDIQLPEEADAPIDDPIRFVSLLNSAAAVRLVKAYLGLPDRARRQAFVELAEKVAERVAIHSDRWTQFSRHALAKSLRAAPPKARKPVVARSVEIRARRSHVTELAKRTFGNDEFAAEWLKLPNPALKNRIPIELAKSKVGAQEVEAILTRIAHGVYS